MPLIEDIIPLFPNEWLAFIIPPAEAKESLPCYGRLIAHSPNPDDVYDTVNTVAAPHHNIYLFFNGDLAAMQASYDEGAMT